MNRIRAFFKQNIAVGSFILAQIFAPLVVFSIMIAKSGQGINILLYPSTDTIIMYIFMGIMLVVLWWFGFMPLWKMQNAEKDFFICTNNIRKKINAGSILYAQDLKNEITSKNSIIKGALRDFAAEASRCTYERSDIKITLCDIQDFINEEFITQKVANSHVSETIPGIMTGLGILGTFVGLTIGLQGFNAESTQAMTASIEPLIEGIRTAFYTSIAGIIFSVCYNLIYKRQLVRTLHATDDFINEVYIVVPDPEAEARFRTMEEQFHMTSQLAEFAQDVGTTVTKSLTDTVAPVMKEITQTFENYANASSAAQVDGIEKVSEKFIEKMNASLGDSFDRLGDTINQLCNWQEQSYNQMKKTIDEICSATSNIEMVNENCQSVISRFQTHAEAMNEMLQTLKDATAEVQAECKNAAEMMGTQKTYFEQLHEEETKRLEATEILRSMIARFETIEDTTKTFIEQINKSFGDGADVLTKTINDMHRLQEDSYSKMVNTINGIDDATEKVDVINANCQDVIEALKRYTEYMNDIQRMLIGATAEVQAECKNAAEMMGTQKSYFQSLQAEETKRQEAISILTDSIKSVTEQSSIAKQQILQAEESITQVTATANTQIEEVRKALQLQSSTVYATMQNMKNETEAAIARLNIESEKLIKAVTGELQAGANSFITEYRMLDDRSEKNLMTTFEKFDAGISEIVMHFSGTLGETRDILETVPRVLKDTSDKFEKELLSCVEAVSTISNEAVEDIQEQTRLMREERGTQTVN